MSGSNMEPYEARDVLWIVAFSLLFGGVLTVLGVMFAHLIVWLWGVLP